MRVLALEPYYGGSHQAFLDGWSSRSSHDWTILSLPAYKWKWRMRHAAVTLAERATELVQAGNSWDVMFCSDMLNLAEFRGLADSRVARLPTVAYFHENQLTYPVQQSAERDLHFGFTNFTTALAAERVWFNSNYHLHDFLGALRDLLPRMPDFQPLSAIDQIEEKSGVFPPGIDPMPTRTQRRDGPIRMLWAARWEHDKDPETFFNALSLLRARHVEFRVSVLGESFREVPPVFADARRTLNSHVDHWGFLPSRDDYIAALLDADVFVSTARHEFFGLSAVEAIAAGVFPLLPRRLSYPELLCVSPGSNHDTSFFWEGDKRTLADRLRELAVRVQQGTLWQSSPHRAREIVSRFHWDNIYGQLDQSLVEIAAQRPD